jgi:hypothetical protein
MDPNVMIMFAPIGVLCALPHGVIFRDCKKLKSAKLVTPDSNRTFNFIKRARVLH